MHQLMLIFVSAKYHNNELMHFNQILHYAFISARPRLGLGYFTAIFSDVQFVWIFIVKCTKSRSHKNLNIIFVIFFSSSWCRGLLKLVMQHWVLEYYQFCSNNYPGFTLTYFVARSNLVPYAFVWGKGKTMYFSDTVVVYDIKVGRCSKVNECMNLYEYQRSRSFIDLGRMSLRFNTFRQLFLRNR